MRIDYLRQGEQLVDKKGTLMLKFLLKSGQSPDLRVGKGVFKVISLLVCALSILQVYELTSRQANYMPLELFVI